MTTAKRFERFFSAVNDDHGPYRWQRRLVKLLARDGRWPVGIEMPTGAGKSSVVDIHVFLVAERERVRRERKTARVGIGRPPRRLVLVAPRRALVDDQFEHAQRLAEQLSAALTNPDDHDEVVVDVATSLAALRSVEDGAPLDASPLCVTRLRGGVRLDLDWRLDPGQCQVICATPQMWGSRLLLRGFRASRRARNLEAGLLGHDVAVVIDEAHLHERLIETARRVARDDNGALGLQVVAMSATRAAGDAFRLDDEDLADEKLRPRIEASKRVTVAAVDDWRRTAAAELAKRAESLASRGGSRGPSRSCAGGCDPRTSHGCEQLTRDCSSRKATRRWIISWRRSRWRSAWISIFLRSSLPSRPRARSHNEQDVSTAAASAPGLSSWWWLRTIWWTRRRLSSTSCSPRTRARRSLPRCDGSTRSPATPRHGASARRRCRRRSEGPCRR